MMSRTLAMFATVALCAGFAACSEDDDNGGGASGGKSESAASSVITTTDGEKLLLTSVNGYYFEYDEQGRIISVPDYKFTHNPFTMAYDEYDEYESDEITFTPTLNAKGYLSKLVYVEAETSEDFSERYECVIYYDYNDEGRLVKMRGNWSETQYEDGEKWTDKGTGTSVYTWENGNLVNVKETEKGGSWRYESTTEFAYGNQQNRYNQYTCGMIDVLDAGYGGAELVGLFGKGTANLPVSYNTYGVEIDEEDDYEEDWEYEGTFTFTLNDNGTIASEKSRYDTYYYSYSLLSDLAQANSRDIKSELKKDNNKRFRLFGKHRRR